MWDKHIDALLARLSYYKAVSAAYAAADLFPGQTLLFRQQPPGGGLAEGGPGGAWRPIALLVQPVEVCVLPPAGAGAAAAGQAVQEALLEASRRKSAADAARDTSPLTLPAGVSPLSGRRGYLASPSAFTPRGSDSPTDTYAIIHPLTRLCPERRYGSES